MTWGVWGKKFNTQEMIAAMHHCLEEGVNTFDHADIYGDYTTEGEWGHAFAKAAIPRDQIQLISKCGIQMKGGARSANTVKHYQYDARYIVESAERSLRELKTEYLDLFLLHRPSPLMDVGEIAKAVDKLKTQGKIRDFGLSNFTIAQTDLISSKTEIVANQIEISLTNNNAMTDGSLDHMVTNRITPMSWSPLGVVFKEDIPQTQRIKKALESLQDKYSATQDQLLLAWLLKHPSKIYPVIGTTTKERMTLAVKAIEIEMELKDWFVLLEASEGKEVNKRDINR